MSHLNIDLINWLKSKHIDISRVSPSMRNVPLDTALFEVCGKYPSLYHDFLSNVYNVRVNNAKSSISEAEFKSLQDYAHGLEQEIASLQSIAENDNFDNFIESVQDVKNFTEILQHSANSWGFATTTQRANIKAFLLSVVKNIIDYTYPNISDDIRSIDCEDDFKSMIENILSIIKNKLNTIVENDPKKKAIIADLEHQITNLNNKNANLQKKIDQLTFELSKSNLINEESKEKLNNLTSLNISDKQQIESLGKTIDDLRKQVSESQKLQEQIDKINELNKQMKEECDRVKQENAELQRILNAQFKQIIDYLQTVGNNDLNYRTTTDSIINLISDIKQDPTLQDVFNENIRLKAEVSRLNGIIQQLNQEVNNWMADGVRARNETVRRDQEVNNWMADGVRARNETVRRDQEVNNWMADGVRARNESVQLNVANQQLNADNQQLRNDNQQLNADIQQLRNDNQNLNVANQQLNADIQQLRNDNQQLNNANQQLNQQLNIANQQVGNITNDKQQLENELQVQRREHENTLRGLNQLIVQLQSCRDENEELKNDLQEHENTLRELNRLKQIKIKPQHQNVFDNSDDESSSDDESDEPKKPMKQPPLQLKKMIFSDSESDEQLFEDNAQQELDAKIKQKQAELEALEQHIKDIEIQYAKLKEENGNNVEKLRTLTMENEDLMRKITDQNELQREIKESQDQVEQLQEQVGILNERLEHSVDSEKYEQNLSHIIMLQKVIEDKNEKIKGFKNLDEARMRAINNLQWTFDAFTDTLNEVASKDKHAMEDAISDLKQKRDITIEKINEVKETLNEHQNMLNEVDDKDGWLKLIAADEKSIKDLEEMLKHIDKEINILESIENSNDFASDDSSLRNAHPTDLTRNRLLISDYEQNIDQLTNAFNEQCENMKKLYAQLLNRFKNNYSDLTFKHVDIDENIKHFEKAENDFKTKIENLQETELTKLKKSENLEEFISYVTKLLGEITSIISHVYDTYIDELCLPLIVTLSEQNSEFNAILTDQATDIDMTIYPNLSRLIRQIQEIEHKISEFYGSTIDSPENLTYPLTGNYHDFITDNRRDVLIEPFNKALEIVIKQDFSKIDEVFKELDYKLNECGLPKLRDGNFEDRLNEYIGLVLSIIMHIKTLLEHDTTDDDYQMDMDNNIHDYEYEIRRINKDIKNETNYCKNLAIESIILPKIRDNLLTIYDTRLMFGRLYKTEQIHERLKELDEISEDHKIWMTDLYDNIQKSKVDTSPFTRIHYMYPSTDRSSSKAKAMICKIIYDHVKDDILANTIINILTNYDDLPPDDNLSKEISDNLKLQYLSKAIQFIHKNVLIRNPIQSGGLNEDELDIIDGRKIINESNIINEINKQFKSNVCASIPKFSKIFDIIKANSENISDVFNAFWICFDSIDIHTNLYQKNHSSYIQTMTMFERLANQTYCTNSTSPYHNYAYCFINLIVMMGYKAYSDGYINIYFISRVYKDFIEPALNEMMDELGLKVEGNINPVNETVTIPLEAIKNKIGYDLSKLLKPSKPFDLSKSFKPFDLSNLSKSIDPVNSSKPSNLSKSIDPVNSSKPSNLSKSSKIASLLKSSDPSSLSNTSDPSNLSNDLNSISQIVESDDISIVKGPMGIRCQIKTNTSSNIYKLINSNKPLSAVMIELLEKNRRRLAIEFSNLNNLNLNNTNPKNPDGISENVGFYGGLNETIESVDDIKNLPANNLKRLMIMYNDAQQQQPIAKIESSPSSSLSSMSFVIQLLFWFLVVVVVAIIVYVAIKFVKNNKSHKNIIFKKTSRYL